MSRFSPSVECAFFSDTVFVQIFSGSVKSCIFLRYGPAILTAGFESCSPLEMAAAEGHLDTVTHNFLGNLDTVTFFFGNPDMVSVTLFFGNLDTMTLFFGNLDTMTLFLKHRHFSFRFFTLFTKMNPGENDSGGRRQECG